MNAADLPDLGLAVCEVASPSPDGHGCTCRLRGECPSPGKHPVGRHWLKSAIGRWERGHRAPAVMRLAPVTSYGLVPVPGSGIIVVDRDDPSVLLPMPETFEVHRASADPRKGHYYFRLADGISEDEVPRGFSGGDVRVAGSGHVVGSGSRHVSGDLYEPNGSDVGIADRDLIDALSALKPIRRGAGGGLEAVEGSRHAWLVGQARKLAGWSWDAERIEQRLRELNEEYCSPALSENVAEFGRMAEWAAKNVVPDRPITVTKTRLREKRGWAR